MNWFSAAMQSDEVLLWLLYPGGTCLSTYIWKDRFMDRVVCVCVLYMWGGQMHANVFVCEYKGLILSIAFHFIPWGRVSQFSDLTSLCCHFALRALYLALESWGYEQGNSAHAAYMSVLRVWSLLGSYGCMTSSLPPKISSNPLQSFNTPSDDSQLKFFLDMLMGLFS